MTETPISVNLCNIGKRVGEHSPIARLHGLHSNRRSSLKSPESNQQYFSVTRWDIFKIYFTVNYFGAKMVPSHSPKPIRFPSLSQCPVILTESPFFRNFRISSSSNFISRVPFQLKLVCFYRQRMI